MWLITTRSEVRVLPPLPRKDSHLVWLFFLGHGAPRISDAAALADASRRFVHEELSQMFTSRKRRNGSLICPSPRYQDKRLSRKVGSFILLGRPKPSTCSAESDAKVGWFGHQARQQKLASMPGEDVLCPSLATKSYLHT